MDIENMLSITFADTLGDRTRCCARSDCSSDFCDKRKCAGSQDGGEGEAVGPMME